jgi:phage terminase large subunit-like protein
MMFCDGEHGAELYSVACKKDQAKIIWSESVRMIKSSPSLNKRAKCLVAEIKFKNNSFKALSSDSNSLDGLNSHCILIDELHSWKDRNLYDVVKQSISARQQSLILITTTAGTIRGNIFDSKYDECLNILKGYSDNSYTDNKVLPLLYQLDSPDEYTNPDMWIKANPNLGISKSIDYLKSEINKAQKQPELKVGLLCKDFNIRQNSVLSYFNFSEINNIEIFNLENIKFAIGGLDISSTTDLTSATILFLNPDNPEKLFFHSCSWIPSEKLQEKEKEDNIPYSKWIEKGYLRLCEGNKIDPMICLDWFIELYKTKGIIPYKLGFDTWGSQTFVNEFEKYFGKDVLIPVRQGSKTLSNPLKTIKADFQSNKIIYNNDPCVKTALVNVSIEIDKNENIRPVKSTQRGRIDPFMAMLNAYTIYQIHEQDFRQLNKM